MIKFQRLVSTIDLNLEAGMRFKEVREMKGIYNARKQLLQPFTFVWPMNNIYIYYLLTSANNKTR